MTASGPANMKKTMKLIRTHNISVHAALIQWEGDREMTTRHHPPSDQSIHSFLHDIAADLAATVSALSRLTECGSLACITESMTWISLSWKER